MNEVITMSELVHFCAIIVGVWGFIKIVMEIVKNITARHDREQKWDETAERLNEEREKIVERYDSKLNELEKKITDYNTDTESKLQQIRAEQAIMTTSMLAVLDGLQQLNCNGNVTKAHKELEEYLVKSAYNR